MRIHLLTASDVPPYRALMLQAYEQAPDAFTSTAAEPVPRADWPPAQGPLVGGIASDFTASIA